jgi:putative FmdB family regulatory protein
MPIYEYVCLDCHKKFDALRSMSEADAAIRCKNCQSEHTSRAISLFAAHSGGRVVAGTDNTCNTCSTHHCSSCGI